jgi:hypothetical protein
MVYRLFWSNNSGKGGVKRYFLNGALIQNLALLSESNCIGQGRAEVMEIQFKAVFGFPVGFLKSPSGSFRLKQPRGMGSCKKEPAVKQVLRNRHICQSGNMRYSWQTS